MVRGKINFFDILDKYEYWKGKCVISVLGECSSGVAICRNKGAQSDLWAPFLPGAARGTFSPDLPESLGLCNLNVMKRNTHKPNGSLFLYRLIVFERQYSDLGHHPRHTSACVNFAPWAYSSLRWGDAKIIIRTVSKTSSVPTAGARVFKL